MSFAKRVMQKAFEWATDYKPWETELEYREYAQHGYVVGYMQAFNEHGFNAYIEREFKKNFELAREELAMEAEDTHGEMEYSERRAWNVAIEWTQDDIANQVGSYLSQKW